MKKFVTPITALLLFTGFAKAQETVYPTKEYKGQLFITNGTVHVGNGQVLENATIEENNGKIVSVGTDIHVTQKNTKILCKKRQFML